MLLLVLRTDKPDAEIGLYEDDKRLAYDTWEAHRRLAETLHYKITDLLLGQGKKLEDIAGLVMYQGPGSFTGLRIGLSVGNALAHSYGLSVVGATGEDWQEQGVRRLLAGSGETLVLPDYGAPVFITTPRK